MGFYNYYFEKNKFNHDKLLAVEKEHRPHLIGFAFPTCGPQMSLCSAVLTEQGAKG